MNFEREKFKSRLTVLESRVVAARLRVEHLRDAMRDLLDPTLPVENLDQRSITSLAVDFGAAHIILAEILAEMQKLREHLGR